MNKREFLKLSSAPLVAPLVAPVSRVAQAAPMKNWARNLQYGTDTVSYPESVAEVQRLVRQHPSMKVLGTRHCFNGIADSSSAFVSLEKMRDVVALDADAATVTIEGGMNYGQLCPYLNGKGFALHNLASLPHISVAGACSTATHGSGVSNGNLATAVRALEVVIADGTVITLSRESDVDAFHAAIVGLGAIGVITRVTLAVQPAFTMRQYVYERLPVSQMVDRFDDIIGAAYSVSLFTDWRTDSVNEVWVKSLAAAGPGDDRRTEFFGARPASRNLHPIAELSAENCTQQMGVPGPWHERLPHFRMGFTPSSGTELQAEYFVPRRHAVEAIRAIARMGPQIAPVLLISEIRSVAADDLWMSPCYREACVAIHFTWKQDWPAVRTLLPVIERELDPFNVKPHWGKLFTMAPATLQSRYERLADYRQVVARYDPQAKFRNEFLARHLYGH